MQVRTVCTVLSRFQLIRVHISAMQLAIKLLLVFLIRFFSCVYFLPFFLDGIFCVWGGRNET